MKYLVYVVVLAVVAGGALFMRKQMINNAATLSDGPTAPAYAKSIASNIPLAIEPFQYKTADDIAMAGRDMVGKEEVAVWVKPALDAGWVFKGAKELSLPGEGRTGVWVFEKDGQTVYLFMQVYIGTPDLSAHRGKSLTIKPDAAMGSESAITMYWSGGGVVYFASSPSKTAVESFASAMGWPGVSGEW